MSATTISKISDTQGNKIHPWRKCPIGKHLVREHIVHVPPSKTHPNGITSTWHEHCAANPSHKDELSYAEIQHITETHFSTLTTEGESGPTAGVLTEFSSGDKYDNQIRGWVRYWNEVFNPINPLDPNLIKALIATESSFDPRKVASRKDIGHARGLMQIIDQTWRILGDHKGELKNHLIPLMEKELFDPSANICVGIRWLFRKKETASGRLKREATWDEAIEDYKSILKKRIDGKKYNPKPMNDIHDYYKRLQGK